MTRTSIAATMVHVRMSQRRDMLASSQVGLDLLEYPLAEDEDAHQHEHHDDSSWDMEAAEIHRPYSLSTGWLSECCHRPDCPACCWGLASFLRAPLPAPGR